MAQVSLEGPLIFCNEIGARIERMEDDELRLSARFLRSGVYTRSCWERVFSRFLNEARLTVEENRSLRRKFAANQRALGLVPAERTDSRRSGAVSSRVHA